MPPLHINDQTVIGLVDRLVEATGQTRTALVLAALDHFVADKFPQLKQEPAPAEPATEAELHAELERSLRATTLDYQRLKARQANKRMVGSRIYKMIADNGVIGTLAKLVERPTEGLEFLMEIGRLDLAAEELVLNQRFRRIIPDDLRNKAERNIRMAKAALAHRSR